MASRTMHGAAAPAPQPLTEALLGLPAEIRLHIFRLLFHGSTAGVTASSECVCTVSKAAGPYSPAHQFLLNPGSRQLRQEAWQVFLQTTLWQFHCFLSLQQFTERLKVLSTPDWNCLSSVRKMTIVISQVENYASDAF